MKTVGSKAEVWHSSALHTSGGLMKRDLMYRKGRIISRKKHAAGKKAIKHLVALGYKAKKGTFTLFRKSMVDGRKSRKQGSKSRRQGSKSRRQVHKSRRQGRKSRRHTRKQGGNFAELLKTVNGFAGAINGATTAATAPATATAATATTTTP